MTTRQIHITWGIIVVILLGVIFFLAFGRRAGNNYQNYQASQNAVVNTEANTVTQTIPPATQTAEWITYKNTKYNFEMSVPAGNDISNTTASQIFFNSGNGQTQRIEIIVREAIMQNGNTKTPISFKNYAYMDMPRVGEGTMGGQVAAIFEAPKGSCDGPVCTEPYVAYATDRPNPMFYSLVFYGDTKLSTEEQYMLDSFKFTSTESLPKYLTYTNNRFGFSVNLPERWTGYKVIESKNGTDYSYTFELKLKDNTYGKPFVISVFTPESWKKIKSGLNYYTYINENNKYVFVYGTTQDDDNYLGFPEIVPGVQFHGPIYDVQTVIIPSFKLN
jgi:hypothetical protein